MRGNGVRAGEALGLRASSTKGASAWRVEVAPARRTHLPEVARGPVHADLLPQELAVAVELQRGKLGDAQARAEGLGVLGAVADQPEEGHVGAVGGGLAAEAVGDEGGAKSHSSASARSPARNNASQASARHTLRVQMNEGDTYIQPVRGSIPRQKRALTCWNTLLSLTQGASSSDGSTFHWISACSSRPGSALIRQTRW